MSDASGWTEERVELLKKLWNDGLSASQIAGELGGVTRNAVIGKVHRLGLSGRAKTPSSAAARPRKAVTRAPAGFSGHAPATRGATALSPRPRPAPEAQIQPRVELLDPDVVVPFSERVTIMELRENMCRWPMGDPVNPDFRFCGLKTDAGVPYCAYHCRIAYQPANDRRREREQERRAQLRQG